MEIKTIDDLIEFIRHTKIIISELRIPMHPLHNKAFMDIEMIAKELKANMEADSENKVKISLNALDEAANEWGNQVNIKYISQKICNNIQAIEDMLHQAFIEGAYRASISQSSKR